jgi:TPR repeat protein
MTSAMEDGKERDKNHRVAKPKPQPAQLLDKMFDLAEKCETNGQNAQAFKMYQDLAEKGHAGAQYQLSQYMNKEKALEKGLDLLMQAAVGGYAQAQRDLGSLMLEGNYLEKDIPRGLGFLKIAAGQGYAAAQFDLFAYYHNVDTNIALGYLKDSAKQKHLPALYEMGRLWFYGSDDFDIEQNVQNGIRLLTYAAENGHAPSAYQLGTLYAQRKDMNEIEHGEPNKIEAKYGIKRDLAMGMKFYNLAADQGDAEALFQLGQIFHFPTLYVSQEEGKQLGIYKKEDQAVKLFQQAAEQGNISALRSLAYCYDNGVGGLPENKQKALGIYKQIVDLSEGFSKESAIGDYNRYLAVMGQQKEQKPGRP